MSHLKKGTVRCKRITFTTRRDPLTITKSAGCNSLWQKASATPEHRVPVPYNPRIVCRKKNMVMVRQDAGLVNCRKGGANEH